MRRLPSWTFRTCDTPEVATSTSRTKWSATARSRWCSFRAGFRISSGPGKSRRLPASCVAWRRFLGLIMFDKRGTGLSDRVAVDDLPTMEQRMDDVRAVMDAAGVERAALLSVSEGGPMCILFATTYPQRTEALVMLGGYARRLWAEDYPFGETQEEYDGFLQSIQQGWGGAVGIEARAPSMLDDRAVSDVVGDLPSHERESRSRLRADA